ncbi:MAG: endo alpha-1,4 polygalactosaminidase [Alphaproteobacteria bacterium]|nr:endo alpha-1,4 polygalactosaminidase [Alphaproteobacteria bacterium]
MRPVQSVVRLFAWLALAVTGSGAMAQSAPMPWAVYYANDLPPNAFYGYDFLVFEAEAHPPLEPLIDRGKKVVGYISLGEVEQFRSYFAEVKAEGILRQENENWKGSFFVDVRDPRWTKRVVEELVPDILRRGFQGIFMDTLDNPPHLERTDPKANAGMTEAAARLVCTLRRNFPGMIIVLNRGYELLPSVERDIDMVLGESVYADYDFAEKKYGRVDEPTYRQQVEILQAAARRQPKLKILTLDYWDPNDPKGIADIYRVQAANGFSPYVATVELDELIPRPK